MSHPYYYDSGQSAQSGTSPGTSKSLNTAAGNRLGRAAHAHPYARTQGTVDLLTSGHFSRITSGSAHAVSVNFTS